MIQLEYWKEIKKQTKKMVKINVGAEICHGFYTSVDLIKWA